MDTVGQHAPAERSIGPGNRGFEDCKQSCLNNAKCLGISVNDQKPAQCYMAGLWSGKEITVAGVTHYQLCTISLHLQVLQIREK